MLFALVNLAVALVAAGPLSGAAHAALRPGAPSVSQVAAVVSVDVAANLTVGSPVSWSLPAGGLATFVTVACAAFGTNVTLTASYGGSTMTSAVAYHYQPLYVGIWYLASPPAGNQNAAVALLAADGGTPAECSATGWTGVAGVDTSMMATSWEWGYIQSYLMIDPPAAVPSGEVFFSALSRYEWGEGTQLTAASADANASVVDSNTALGYGCQIIPNHPDVDCVASAILPAPGTSLTFSWAAYGGFAVAAGVGLVAGSAPAGGGGTVGMSLGIVTALAVLGLVAVGVVVAAVAVVLGRRPRPTLAPSRASYPSAMTTQSLGELFCPVCGTRYDPSAARFCTRDGTELRAAR